MRHLLAVALIVALCSPVFGVSIVDDPYWKIDETLVEAYSNGDDDQNGDLSPVSAQNGDNGIWGNMIGLTVTNMHDTLGIDGFAVSIGPDYNWLAGAPSDWVWGHVYPHEWNNDVKSGLGDQTCQQFFGKSFVDAFPNYIYGDPDDEDDYGWGVIFFAADQRLAESERPSIGPGEVAGLEDPLDDTSFLFYYLTGNVPHSDAIIRLTDGSPFVGLTDEPNPFPTDDNDDDDSQSAPIPEPTTLGLLALGSLGMLRRRRSA